MHLLPRAAHKPEVVCGRCDAMYGTVQRQRGLTVAVGPIRLALLKTGCGQATEFTVFSGKERYWKLASGKSAPSN